MNAIAEAEHNVLLALDVRWQQILGLTLASCQLSLPRVSPGLSSPLAVSGTMPVSSAASTTRPIVDRAFIIPTPKPKSLMRCVSPSCDALTNRGRDRAASHAPLPSALCTDFGWCKYLDVFVQWARLLQVHRRREA
jgi:hypothetical protein